MVTSATQVYGEANGNFKSKNAFQLWDLSNDLAQLQPHEQSPAGQCCDLPFSLLGMQNKEINCY
jgi:hypothetical protein